MNHELLFSRLMKGLCKPDGTVTRVGRVEMTARKPGHLIECPDCCQPRGRGKGNVRILDQELEIDDLVIPHMLVHGLIVPGHATLDPDTIEILSSLPWVEEDGKRNETV